jgi:hypothetical protein
VVEALIAFVILLFFLGVAYLNAFLSWEALVMVGASLAAFGLAIGLPGGLLYHVKLRRALLTKGALPHRWWLRPANHHAALAPAQWRQIRSAFFVGALGFSIIMLGAVLTFLSVFK